MRIGLYSGSFNPIHHGHVMLANYLVEFSDLDELWFVVSPQNPLKKKEDLMRDEDRLKMVELALEGDSRLKVSDIEMSLPIPSYTINTLRALSERYPARGYLLRPAAARQCRVRSPHSTRNRPELCGKA